jgi:arylamine N-acetyltransferase
MSTSSSTSTSPPSSATSVWPSATTSGKLSRAHATAYLERIDLPAKHLDDPPSLDLLRKLQCSHMLAVPFESLTVHVPSWHDLDAEINLGGGETTHLGEKSYQRIVDLKRGSYCFGINSTFATLLRYFGFRVSECAARVFTQQMQNPEDVGFEWESTSHQFAFCPLSIPSYMRLLNRLPSRRVSIVDWQGSEGRFLVDVGFGRSSAYPFVSHSLHFHTGTS